MKREFWLAMGAAALVLAGCGDGGGSTSGSERNRMVEACLSATNNERPMCECVADLARDELTPASFDMLLATLEEDEARAMRLRGQLSLEETMQSGMFMVNAFGRCARSMSEG